MRRPPLGSYTRERATVQGLFLSLRDCLVSTTYLEVVSDRCCWLGLCVVAGPAACWAVGRDPSSAAFSLIKMRKVT